MYLGKYKRNTEKFLKHADIEELAYIFDTDAYKILSGLIQAIEKDMEDAFLGVDPRHVDAKDKLLVERAIVEGSRQLTVNLETELRKIKARLRGE